ncbi:MAG TPA: hypothetical protein VK110_06510 [Salinisphaeraceae bacterium]|nr:hypothetical protein [Salinisphaeraceae bacterium]
MAEPLRYQVPAENPAQQQREQAYAELDQLVLLLHKHQALRLAGDATAALADMTRIVTQELATDEGKQALENLYLLLRILGRIPPEKMQRFATATSEAFEQLEQFPPEDQPYPPGIGGSLKLLRDEELWEALGPLLEGLKAFAARQQEY